VDLIKLTALAAVILLGSSNFAVAGKSKPSPPKKVEKVIEQLRDFCPNRYGKNNHVDTLPADAGGLQRICAYAWHPIEDLARTCQKIYGDNPAPPDLGQRICSRIRKAAQH
jgi:hypothetical protein